MSLSDQDFQKLQEVACFTNISDAYFEHTFAWGEAPPVLHRFDPGETRMLPFPIANHLAKHLAMKIIRGGASTAALKDNRALATPEKISALKQEILSSKSKAEVERPKTVNEAIEEHIDTLNPEDREIVAPEGISVETKADIVAALKARGAKFNPRRSKAELKEQLDAELLA